MTKIIKLTDDEFFRLEDILFDVGRDPNFSYEQRKLAKALVVQMRQHSKEKKNVSKNNG